MRALDVLGAADAPAPPVNHRRWRTIAAVGGAVAGILLGRRWRHPVLSALGGLAVGGGAASVALGDRSVKEAVEGLVPPAAGIAAAVVVPAAWAAPAFIAGAVASGAAVAWARGDIKKAFEDVVGEDAVKLLSPKRD